MFLSEGRKKPYWKSQCLCSPGLGLPTGETALLGNVSWGMGIPRMNRKKMLQIKNPWAERKNVSGGLIRLIWRFLCGLNVAQKRIVECDDIPRKAPRSKNQTQTTNAQMEYPMGASIKVQHRDWVMSCVASCGSLLSLSMVSFLSNCRTSRNLMSPRFQNDSEFTKKEKKGRKIMEYWGWGKSLKSETGRVTFHLKTCYFWDHGLLSRNKYFFHSKGLLLFWSMAVDWESSGYSLYASLTVCGPLVWSWCSVPLRVCCLIIDKTPFSGTEEL